MSLVDVAKKRRSCYALTNSIPLTDKQLVELVEQAILYAPSAFNSQSARVMILLGEQHHLFWKLVREELKKIVPAENFLPTAEKVAAFDRAHGTLLFLEDWTVVRDLQERFPTYRDNFPIWAYQSNGMLEYLIWMAFAERNIGASLQHYNPLVDEAVMHRWHVPATWKLVAQMPFGNIETAPAEKEFLPLSLRMRVEK